MGTTNLPITGLPLLPPKLQLPKNIRGIYANGKMARQLLTSWGTLVPRTANWAGHQGVLQTSNVLVKAIKSSNALSPLLARIWLPEALWPAVTIELFHKVKFY